MKRCLPFLLMMIQFVIQADTGLNLQRQEATVPIRESGVVSLFTAAEGSRWQLAKGSNTDAKLQFGVAAGSATVMQLDVRRLNSEVKDSNANWFTLQAAVASAESWQQADGVGLILGLRKEGGWWMDMALGTDAGQFSQVIEPYGYTPGSTLACRLLPFDQFKARKKDGSLLDRNRITGLTLTGASSDNTLYVEKIFLYRRSEQQWQATVSYKPGNKPKTAIYERGEPVQLTFTASGNSAQMPAPTALAVRITDYFDRVIADQQLKPDAMESGSQKFAIEFPSLPSGYYEVQAWPLDAKGSRLMPDSCIKATGSQPQGKATFAVMPRTIAENHARSAKLGEQAFFGLHGDYANLGDCLGVTWRLGAQRWGVREPKERPDRSNGPAPWAAKALGGPVEPAWSYRLENFDVNHKGVLPAWATSAAPDLLPNFQWSDFEAYFRDEIKVTKHNWPHQKTRLYDVTWEINLNSPEILIHKPVYLPADVVDIYRRAHPVLQQEDPGARLLGPCVSSLGGYKWLEELFRIGLVKYIDGFNFHGYHAPPPEKSKVPEEIRKLRQLIRKYNDGKELDMYCSELGYRSLYGPADRNKEHAQWHVRVAIMLKGEGVKVYCPFYGYDYIDNKNTFGLTYNLHPDWKFGPNAVMPKAAVPGLAVCIDQIEGMAPLSDLPWFGSDIYGYFFRNGKEITLAVWSVDNPQRIRLPVGNPSSPMEIVDMMGGRTVAEVKNGNMVIELTQSPVYLLHLPPELYGHGIKAANVTVTGFPGPQGKPVAEPGLYLLSAGGGEHPATWLSVQSPVEIVEVGPSYVNRQKCVEIKVANRGAAAIPVDLSIDSAATGLVKRQLTITASTVMPVIIPFTGADTDKPVIFNIIARSGNAPAVSTNKKINFLASHRRGQAASGDLLPNTITWKGTGSSGQPQTVRAELEWDEQNLYVTVETDDDVQCQSSRDQFIWKEDGLQLAFDTNPESNELYNPLAGIFTKKITALDFALTDKGEVIAWRHDTHNPDELPTGALAASAVKADITRNEEKRQTIYRLAIPWREIGLERVSPGKTIGIDLLVNDKDTGGERRFIELFGGISHGINRNDTGFGSFTLQ
ncbi:MAG: sugar-binding protein [Victivallales bacterium]